MNVNVNNKIFAKEGARVAPCMGISGYMGEYSYIGTEEQWARTVNSATGRGYYYYWEAYGNSFNVGDIGRVLFITQYGYTYGYVMDMYGDYDSFGFTTEGIHKRYLNSIKKG
jgi:hypothetical protein